MHTVAATYCDKVILHFFSRHVVRALNYWQEKSIHDVLYWISHRRKQIRSEDAKMLGLCFLCCCENKEAVKTLNGLLMSWRCCDPEAAELRHLHDDTAMTLLWHDHDTAMTRLWHVYDTAMTLLWHCYDTALTRLTRLWHGYDTAMTWLQHDYNKTTTRLRHDYNTTTIRLQHDYNTTTTRLHHD